jgi:hypothetical protein
MDLTNDERAILLRALVELTVTMSEFDNDPDRDLIPIARIPPAMIRGLVAKLGGNPDDALFGTEPV